MGARNTGLRVVAVALLLRSGAALAGATGLASVPTVDSVPQRRLNISFQNANTATRDDPRAWSRPMLVAQFQVGLSSRIEAGIDLVPLDTPADYRPQLNVKWRALEEDYGRPAIAAGVAQIGTALSPAGYVVITRTLNYTEIRNRIFRAHHRNIKLRGRRLHAGIWRQAGTTLAIAGADVELGDHFIAAADWTSGSGHALSAGGTYVIDENSSTALYLLRGNTTGRLDGILVNFTHLVGW